MTRCRMVPPRVRAPFFSIPSPAFPLALDKSILWGSLSTEHRIPGCSRGVKITLLWQQMNKPLNKSVAPEVKIRRCWESFLNVSSAPCQERDFISTALLLVANAAPLVGKEGTWYGGATAAVEPTSSFPFCSAKPSAFGGANPSRGLRVKPKNSRMRKRTWEGVGGGIIMRGGSWAKRGRQQPGQSRAS